jgi:F0F1-type ATP synthase assembly protein I
LTRHAYRARKGALSSSEAVIRWVLAIMPDVEPSVMRQLARLSTIGIGLVAATAIGLLLGYGLDWLLGTTPWLTMLFTLFGIAAGFLNLFRDVGIIGRKRR